MTNIILISGARKGIGRALCEYFLKGNHIVIGCSRKASDLEDRNYTHYTLDAADEKAAALMVKEIRQKHSRIDVLINNAGTASMNHILATPASTLEKIFSTNFYGTFILTREAAKVMMKQRYGRIVNLTTVAVPLVVEGESVYSASKAAIEHFTKTAARELAGFGITVNALGPTPTDTDLVKTIPKEKIDALLERQSIKRYAEIRDIIHAIEFFIDEKSDFITGQVLYLGGVS